MSRYSRLLVSVLTILLLTSIATASAAAQSCRPIDDESEMLLWWVRREARGEADDADARLKRLHLDRLDSTQVVYVKTAAICALADSAIRAWRPDYPPKSLIVVQAGTKLVLSDPSKRAGEWRLGYVFDSSGQYLTGFSF